MTYSDFRDLVLVSTKDENLSLVFYSILWIILETGGIDPSLNSENYRKAGLLPGYRCYNNDKKNPINSRVFEILVFLRYYKIVWVNRQMVVDFVSALERLKSSEFSDDVSEIAWSMLLHIHNANDNKIHSVKKPVVQGEELLLNWW